MTAARQQALASQARRVYLDALVRGIVQVGSVLGEAAQQLLLLPAEYHVAQARRDGVAAWNQHGPGWQLGFAAGLRQAASPGGVCDARAAAAQGPSSLTAALSLVDDDTIEREIIASRLALAMMDKASWEFTDLRTRIQQLEGRDELGTDDLLRAHVVASVALDAWYRSGLGSSEWQLLKAPLHLELAQLLGGAYHETNHWLIDQGVMPEVDLRPFIRRTAESGGSGAAGRGPSDAAGETPFMARQVAPTELQRSQASAAAGEVMALLQRVVSRQVPGFAAATPTSHAPTVLMSQPPSLEQARPSRLAAAMHHAQEAMHRRSQAASAPDIELPAAQQLEELNARSQAFKQVLKQAAGTPAERATIEIVALLFQSILQEERIPASVRVWFARLQMPVLRVAVSEPDFFAAADHPARALIDRMGACVMGFNTQSGSGVGEALEREIKRIVQVVEAYPDTGRRVFQTVLTEFEKFLDNYFENENQASMKGVSLAQQVEQRETLAIQYTIELRKMLNEVPVQDGVREFLFQVWADVLAVTAVRTAAHSEETKAMKRAAADLIWSASAKVSREERAEVIRRLPPLLKTLRDGMGQAGLPASKQDEQIRALNNSLAAAFTAKAATIPRERLEELMDQLQALEALLPEGGLEINESLVRDLSGHESEDLEVVAEGGSTPTPAMLAWARELQVGSWYMLDYRGRNEAVQLAWRGMRHQLTLFVSPQGRGVLFQLSRLAAFLQAGLLLPAQDEALTVKATRNALAKLDADPSRLLN
ncbi:DUF1631 family protein [Kinneretia asaccharophila]|uniref:Uncharacterized protein DUF1631 n=1 Tax=Roseateles asaccharophilus TaxID=582607 RepID=A0A4R6MZX7_9BURK|nr:DUF1631 family protein [Roseateles asaccharophilus]MDN3544320.1 DUF1631 family protein [Roseateles asaccharophilus]TDP06401.1 uncharacterized protein DUF1631 [Roseateles asaccharophilus]